jgi:hypothetical protein
MIFFLSEQLLSVLHLPPNRRDKEQKKGDINAPYPRPPTLFQSGKVNKKIPAKVAL